MEGTETSQDEVALGTLDYQEAKRLKAMLLDLGIQVRLAGNPEACKTKTCKPVVELFALAKDIPGIREFFKQEQSRIYDGLDVNPEQHNQVFDTEQENAQCPACGTTFSTKLKECPDCGLVFVME